MTKKVTLYLVRHGKTMFNALGRTQGWSDTPLTTSGIKDIEDLGVGLQEIPFEAVYSSDSGRAIETARILLKQHPKGSHLDYFLEPRIREWCFGSLEGGYNGDLWGVVPRILMYPNYEEMIHEISYEDLANAILAADTAGWAEPYEKIRERIYSGFEDIAYEGLKRGGGNLLVVSHSLTIATFLHLIDEKEPLNHRFANGGVTTISYEDGQFTILKKNNLDFLNKGKNAR